MPKEYNRSDRVADFIKREVASLLQKNYATHACLTQT